METKKLITYLTCEKFDNNIFTEIEQRYKSIITKDVIVVNITQKEQIILFKYGVIVCWNVQFENVKFFLDFIEPYKIDAIEPNIIEELNYINADNFNIHLDTISLTSLENTSKIAISHALAQNVKLEQFEKEIEFTIESNSNIPIQLAKKGKINLNKKKISKKIGELFLVKNKINLHYDLLDTPEFFWDYPEFEANYEKVIK